MLGIGDETRADAQNDQGVHLHVCVLLGEQGRDFEGLAAKLALEIDHIDGEPEVDPLDIPPGERLAAVGAHLGDVVGVDGDVGVLFLLRVQPLDDAVVDEVGPPQLPDSQVLQVLAAQHGLPVGEHEKRSPHASLVTVDDDLVHPAIEANVDLVAQQPRPPPLPNLLGQPLGVLMETNEVSVDVDTGKVRLLAPYLLGSQVRQQQLDSILIKSFRNIDHKSSVLHQPTILALWGLVRTEPTPLRRVKIPGLEVGLAPGERGGYSAQVAHGAHVRGPVEKLGHSRAPTYPIASC